MLATRDQTDAIPALVFQVSIKLHHKKVLYFVYKTASFKFNRT